MSATEGQERILVCGDIDGNFEALLVRLEQIVRKVGKFEQVFVCGEFFGPDANENKRLLNGEFVVPIPIYILGPTKLDRASYYTASAGEELAPNVIYLGRKGLFNTVAGLSVAYLSGREGEYQDECHFSSDTVKELIVQLTAGTAFIGVDLLLTSQWPLAVEKYTIHPPDVMSEQQLHMSPLISKLAAQLKPRYHFAALTNCHYERAPYRNHRVLQEQAQHATRFVGLARCGNASRLKWIYAFNIIPMKHLDRARLVEEPNNITEFPYTEVVQEVDAKEYRKQATTYNSQQQQNQYFYEIAGDDNNANDNYHLQRGRKRPHHSKKDFDQAKKPFLPGPCWFCLSSPEVEKHLVVSIADSTYMALAKGALVPDHVLIMPIEHIQSQIACTPEVLEELCKYKTALERYYATKGCVPVCFERNYRTQHLQFQVVPIPIDRAHAVRPAFMSVGELRGIEFSDVPDNMSILDLINEGCPYFYAELPYGQRIYTRSMKGFSMQFGREVMATPELLNMEGRVDWRACNVTKEEEEKAALIFRKEFGKFDFNQME